MVYARQGKREMAIKHYRRSLAFARAIAHPHSASLALSNLGNVLAENGKIEEAIACYQQGIKRYKELNDQRIVVKLLRDLGAANVLLAVGGGQSVQRQAQFQKAISYYAQGIALAEQIGDQEGKQATEHFRTILDRVSAATATETDQAQQLPIVDLAYTLPHANELAAPLKYFEERAAVIMRRASTPSLLPGNYSFW